MNVRSFVKIGLLSVSIISMDIGSAFGWKCSAGHDHKEDEVCSDTKDRPCNDPRCFVDFHTEGELCPFTVFGFKSEGIKYVILPWCVPDEKIAELWFKYGYNNEEKNKMYFPKIELDRNTETERLEFSVQQLKEKFSEENKKLRGQFQKGQEVQESEEKKRRRLKKISTFLQQEKKKIRVPMSDAEKEEERKKIEEIKRREEAEKLAIKERSLERKLQKKKDKK